MSFRNTSALIDEQYFQLYDVPNDILLKYSTAHNKKNNQIYHLKDLVGHRYFYLPFHILKRYKVVDEKIGNYLLLNNILGFKTPFKSKPLLNSNNDIPLYGNLIDPKWCAIDLGMCCNNNCQFCFTSWSKKYPMLSTNEVEKVINIFKEFITIDLLGFTGGEPTLRSDLFQLLTFSNHSGFNNIGITTNGRKFCNIDFTKQMSNFGLKSALVSLHGHNAVIHDKITNTLNSFNETILGISNILNNSIKVVANVVICNANYKYLLDIAKFISNNFGKTIDIRFSYLIFEGEAFENIDNIVVSYGVIRPYIIDAIQYCNENSIFVELANMPLCIPNNNSLNNCYDTKKLSEFIEASPVYKYNIQRGEILLKLNKCIFCKKRDLCRGIQVEYLKKFPNSYNEFNPYN